MPAFSSGATVLLPLAGRGRRLRRWRGRATNDRWTIADAPAGAAGGVIIGPPGAKRAGPRLSPGSP